MKVAIMENVSPKENSKADSDTSSTIQDLLGEPVALDSIPDKKTAEIKAFELYRETAIVLTVIVHMYQGMSEADRRMNRNQAICAGLLVRILKFMSAVLELASHNRHGDVVMALNRCIGESAINLEFLIFKNDPESFDQFVEFSLGPEKELHELIKTNIANRNNEVLPIEQRMLKSIDRTFRISGVDAAAVKAKYPNWGQSLRERLKALGKENLYLAVQRIGSHAVHGTWVDILLHHVEEEKDGAFMPDPISSRVDARQLDPTAIIILGATRAYVEHYFSAHAEIAVLLSRIDDLSARIRRLDAIHETLF